LTISSSVTASLIQFRVGSIHAEEVRKSRSVFSSTDFFSGEENFLIIEFVGLRP